MRRTTWIFMAVILSPVAHGQTLLWDNGPFITGQGCSDAEISLVEPPSNVKGANIDAGVYGNADDFVVPEGEIWTLDHVIFYCFETNAPIEEPIVAAFAELYDHPPERGSMPLAGDMETDRLRDWSFTGIYRETSAPACNRAIKAIEIDLTWAPPLESGEYFIHVQAIGNVFYTGPWATIKTPRGPETNPIGAEDNSRSLNVSTSSWIRNVDPATNAGFDFPFLLYGEREGGGEPALRAAGDCPGMMTFRAENMTPERNVAFIYAFGEGNVEIPANQPCAGVRLGLDRTATLAETIRADAEGVAELSVSVPAAACGRAFLQALDVASCATTNVIRVE